MCFATRSEDVVTSCLLLVSFHLFHDLYPFLHQAQQALTFAHSGWGDELSVFSTRGEHIIATKHQSTRTLGVSSTSNASRFRPSGSIQALTVLPLTLSVA